MLGRFLVTRKQEDIASFKTPGLRNVLVTGPYFHDGSMETLWDVMDHYNKGDGITNPWLDNDMQPLALTEPEIDDVVAFLASLTSPQYKELGDQRVCTPTRSIQSEPHSAGHPAGVRPKAEAATASSALIVR